MTDDIAAPRIRSFRRDVQDLRGERLLDARNIGDLVPNKTRINVISALTSADNVDHYKFRVRGDGGPVVLTPTLPAGVQLQIVTRRNEVIADSAQPLGDPAGKAYNDALFGKLELTAGEYFLKVAREPGGNPRDKPTYLVQLQIGDSYTEDYDTFDRPAAQIQTSAAALSTLQGVGNLLGNFLDTVRGKPGAGGFINLFS